MRSLRRLAAAVAVAAFAWAHPAQARERQTAADAGQAKPQAPSAADPDSSDSQDPRFDQIRNALNRSPVLKLNDDQLRFYIQVIAKQPQFADYIKGYDFINGPTKGGNPMSHQEFLSMVTPKELYSSAGITATDLLQFAFTNWLGRKLLTRALNDIKNAKDEHEAEEIRERIDRELAALNASPRK